MAIVRNIQHGGNGGSNIIVVANYSALPDVTTVSGKFYWCSASQGTSWLPGSFGGTFYNSGMYYSNGVTWEYLNVPYNATQSEVNIGTNTDKFITPNTFANASKWGTKQDSLGYTPVASNTAITGAAKTKVTYDSKGLVISGADATTDDIQESGTPTNKYFTNARSLATVLTGLSASSGTFIATDSVLTAFGKIKYLIDNISTLYQVALTDANFGTFISGLTAKSTPVDADTTNFSDSADSNKAKKVTWANIKATLKSYFDSFYYGIIVNSNTYGTTTNGSTGTYISIYSVLIPAGTFSDLDGIEIETLVKKVGANGTSGVRVYVNTTNAIGTNYIATSPSYASGNLYLSLKREFVFRSGNVEGLGKDVLVTTDEATGALSSNVFTSQTANPANDLYLILAVNGNSADTFTKANFKVTKLKNV